MILVDVNVLLTATMDVYPAHAAMRGWLDSRLNGAARVGLPWIVLLGFARIASNPRVFSNALPLERALQQIGEWLALPTVWTPAPTERHFAVLSELAAAGGATYRLTTDLHLAALSVEHGLVVMTEDRDFARFEGVSWERPLGG